MSMTHDDHQESDVPKLAVEALRAASQRALQAGHTLVLVQDGQLVRIDPSGTTILRSLPDRMKVTTRTKHARS